MMTSMEILVRRCESEQLHLSGAIQSFGALIRIDAGSGRVTHASASLADFLGVEAFKILGEPRESLPWLSAETLEKLPDQPGKRLVIRSIVDRPDFKVDGLAIRGPGCILVELERSDTSVETLSVQQLQTPLLSVPYDDDEVALHHELLTQAFDAITGYDRIMIYRFHSDWSGEVITEKTTPALGSYMGLRFPASDIPAIARDLYMLNSIAHDPRRRSTAGSRRPGVDFAPPDLTWSDLRSVSPVHLEYLRHMGAGASFSVPIRVAGRLLGAGSPATDLSARPLSPDHRAAWVADQCLQHGPDLASGEPPFSIPRQLWIAGSRRYWKPWRRRRPIGRHRQDGRSPEGRRWMPRGSPWRREMMWLSPATDRSGWNGDRR